MEKKVIKYIAYILIGLVLGILMQLMPQLQGQWGQNIFTYMATDLGIWAVICILIASHAESSLHSGFQCFACMAAMVASYYFLVPESFMANLRWAVMAILILPIGIITYWYKQKMWVSVALELFLAANVALDVLTFVDMLNKGQMIVNTAEGAVYTNLTAFALGNYLLLTVLTIFGMIYIPLKRRSEKKRIINS